MQGFRYGVNAECPHGKVLTSLCGCNENPTFGRESWIEIGCCQLSGYDVTFVLGVGGNMVDMELI